MGSVCTDRQHLKFHLYHKKSSREIDIPPRKLFGSGSPATAAAEMFIDSPKSSSEDGVFYRFLPCNNVDDDDDDPYSSDRFRMYEFKVRKCTRSRNHDWTDCPFAHPAEKARRRDPRRYRYSSSVCEEFRKGYCSKGDNCEFAHGVFECWLHPMRYRTEACKDGKNCKRKVCFFAHSTKQLRILSDGDLSPMDSPSPVVNRKYHNMNHCCVFCHSMIASPTSTLMGMSHLSPSPPFSPPISPVKTPEFSRSSYKNALNELMGNLEAMNLNEVAAANSHVNNLFNLDNEQSQFLLSPSTPNPVGSNSNTFFNGDFSGRDFTEGINKYNMSEPAGSSGPDLGWVNDLLT